MRQPDCLPDGRVQRAEVRKASVDHACPGHHASGSRPARTRRPWLELHRFYHVQGGPRSRRDEGDHARPPGQGGARGGGGGGRFVRSRGGIGVVVGLGRVMGVGGSGGGSGGVHMCSSGRRSRRAVARRRGCSGLRRAYVCACAAVGGRTIHLQAVVLDKCAVEANGGLHTKGRCAIFKVQGGASRSFRPPSVPLLRAVASRSTPPTWLAPADPSETAPAVALRRRWLA